MLQSYLKIEKMANKDIIETRWETEDGKDRVKRIIEALQKGDENWFEILKGFPEVDKPEVKGHYDLRGIDLSGKNLAGTNLCKVWFAGADLSGSVLSRVNLDDASLETASLNDTIFDSASLINAHLNKANLNGASLKNANLKGASLVNANLDSASLIKANLSKANLQSASFKDANLRKADASKSQLNNAKFINADIRGANFDHSIICEPYVGGGFGELSSKTDFKGAKYNSKTSFLNIDTTYNNWASNPLLKRHIEDQQWLDVWRNKSLFNKYLLYPVWLISCNCGRSFLLWASWSSVLAIGFGFLFAHYASSFNLTASDGKTLADAHWFMPFYYSIVTFTTLGFGDVVPNYDNWIMQLCITIEVVLGYIMLSGLISILANKLARRA